MKFAIFKTAISGNEIAINLDEVTAVQYHGEETTHIFINGAERYVTVRGTIREVLSKLGGTEVPSGD